MSKADGRGKRPTKSSARPQLDVAAYRGQWVAIDANTYQVVGHGASMEEARQRDPDLSQREPLLYFVPPSDAFFVGRVK